MDFMIFEHQGKSEEANRVRLGRKKRPGRNESRAQGWPCRSGQERASGGVLKSVDPLNGSLFVFPSVE